MNKLLTAAGTALLSLSFISLGFAAQGADSGAGLGTPTGSPSVTWTGRGGMGGDTPDTSADKNKKQQE